MICNCQTWLPYPENKPALDKDVSEHVLVSSDCGVLVAILRYYPVDWNRKESAYIWSEVTTGCGCCCSDLNVTAFMPLPESYQGKSDE